MRRCGWGGVGVKVGGGGDGRDWVKRRWGGGGVNGRTGRWELGVFAPEKKDAGCEGEGGGRGGGGGGGWGERGSGWEQIPFYQQPSPAAHPPPSLPFPSPPPPVPSPSHPPVPSHPTPHPNAPPGARSMVGSGSCAKKKGEGGGWRDVGMLAGVGWIPLPPTTSQAKKLIPNLGPGQRLKKGGFLARSLQRILGFLLIV